MKNTTLLIMAAGIGSRFGGGIKQLEPVGLHNEIIMYYSIHDAIEAGFSIRRQSMQTTTTVKKRIVRCTTGWCWNTQIMRLQWQDLF